MKLLENKAVSIVLMVVLIAAGTWLGGWKGLSSLYSKAEDVFFVGEDGDGICIENDLSERAAAAGNMVTIARKYLGDSQEVKALSDASSALTATEKNRDIATRLAANQALDTAMTALYQRLETENLSDQDETYRQRLYADFNSRNDTISHDPYNQYAQTYNQTLAGFPANLLAALTPVHEAVLFY